MHRGSAQISTCPLLQFLRPTIFAKRCTQIKFHIYNKIKVDLNYSLLHKFFLYWLWIYFQFLIALSQLRFDFDFVLSICICKNKINLEESPLLNATRLYSWHSVANDLCSVLSLNSNIAANILKIKPGRGITPVYLHTNSLFCYIFKHDCSLNMYCWHVQCLRIFFLVHFKASYIIVLLILWHANSTYC